MEGSKIRGRFITIEGVEGAGKSSVVRYIQSILETMKLPCIVTREPGGTSIAEANSKGIIKSIR